MIMKRIAVLDLDSIAYSIGNPNKVLDDEGVPVKVLSKAGNMVFSYTDKTEEELYASADEVMTNILTKSGADSYIGYMKGSDTTTSRVKINPDYKANRKQEPPKWWDTVQGYLFDNWGAKYVNNMEVDDAVNITRLTLPNSFIVAIDGDLLGLEGSHYNWVKNEWVTRTKFWANQKFWSDMICGQTGDSIKGLPGKGPAFFAKLDRICVEHTIPLHAIILNEYIAHFGESEGIREFYKNYNSLYILEKGNLNIPEPIGFGLQANEQASVEHLFTN